MSALRTGADSAEISDDFLAQLKQELVCRRIARGMKLLESRSELLTALDPSSKNAAAFAGYLAQWVDVGYQRPALVKDMLFTGRFVSAQEAHASGLVTRMAAASEIGDAVSTLAREIAANAPLTLKATKEMIRRVAARRRLHPGDDRDLVEMCYTSADFREGVAAFLAKRKPQWTGS